MSSASLPPRCPAASLSRSVKFPPETAAQIRETAFSSLRIPLRKVEGTAAGGLIQPPDKGLAIRTGRFLKVQENALVVSPPALPKYSRTKGFRIVDHRGLPVTDGQKAALGFAAKGFAAAERSLPQCDRPHGPADGGILPQPAPDPGLRPDRPANYTPLVFTVSICYTEENYAEGEHPMPFSLIPGRLLRTIVRSRRNISRSRRSHCC